MSDQPLDLGFITDEVSRTLSMALDFCAAWGISRFELREGSKRRFPFFSPEETNLIDTARKSGATITAVSPGIFKGHIEETAALRRELNDVLPRAIDLAKRFECPTLIAFGFSRAKQESARNRVRVLRAFETAAEQVDAAGLMLALENEPGFWIDRPDETMALLDELDHPSAGLNWDPANLHWGGQTPDYDAFQTLSPCLLNVHVKDFTPDDPDVPWRPVGAGITPWPDLLAWIAHETDLTHVTLETHCEPLEANARASLNRVRTLLDQVPSKHED